MKLVARSLLAIALSLLLPLAATPAGAQASTCEFVLGFKSLHELDPADVGDCVDNQYLGTNQGDQWQHTTRGLMVWRKSDNWTAFTNGYLTWINGPMGLASRLNTNRFDWEHDQDTKPPAPQAQPQVLPPTASPTPSANFTPDSVVNNPAVAYPGWASDEKAYLQARERDAIMHFPTPDPAALDEQLLASFGSKRGTFFAAFQSFPGPLNIFARVQSVSVSSHGDSFNAWWNAGWTIEFHPKAPTRLPLVTSDARNRATVTASWIKESASEYLFDQTGDSNLSEKGGFVFKMLGYARMGDIVSADDVKFYAADARATAISKPT